MHNKFWKVEQGTREKTTKMAVIIAQKLFLKNRKKVLIFY